MPSIDWSEFTVSRWTLFGLSLLPKKDWRIQYHVAYLGEKLLALIVEGRHAFEKDGEIPTWVKSRYRKIRGTTGKPDTIDEYLRVGETGKASWGERDAVVDIIAIAAPHHNLDPNTIPRYMRKFGKALIAEQIRQKMPVKMETGSGKAQLSPVLALVLVPSYIDDLIHWMHNTKTRTPLPRRLRTTRFLELISQTWEELGIRRIPDRRWKSHKCR